MVSFTQLFEKRSAENPAQPLMAEMLFDGIRPNKVSPETALKLSAVYACVSVLASSMAQLPLHVMRKREKNIEVVREHPAYLLLHDEPNAWDTSYKWRETQQAWLLGYGNSFTEIVRDGRGRILSLEPLEPWRVSLDTTGQRPFFVFRGDKGTRAILPTHMLHLRALGSKDRYLGTSPVRQHAQAIGLGLSCQDFGKALYEGHGRPSGIVTLKSALNKDGWEKAKNKFLDMLHRLSGAPGSRNIFLPADVDYKQLTLAPEDLQYIERTKLNRSEIASIFNVPAHMINDLERATFSNISEQSVQFVRHTMMPWVVNWEQELNRKLFTQNERLNGYYVKFNLAGLLRGTAKERAAFYHYAIHDGWLSRNEVRALEDLDPVHGLDDMLFSANTHLVREDKDKEKSKDASAA